MVSTLTRALGLLSLLSAVPGGLWHAKALYDGRDGVNIIASSSAFDRDVSAAQGIAIVSPRMRMRRMRMRQVPGACCLLRAAPRQPPGTARVAPRR
jgi:hypothetical protein